MQITKIKVKPTIKYLSELFNIESEYGTTLPQNCIFNKVTTGCGGTYVALTSSNPTIIAVPTKALVKDKITQEKYKHLNILGVSADYPLKEIPKNCSKIICTYQSLPKVCQKLTIKNWDLVVDEMHLLTRMLNFSRQPLLWLLNNFKEFKSYCFMSATVPKKELLLTQLQNLDQVVLEWSNLKEVSFECLHSDNIEESMLQIIAEHINGTRPGNAYFFYNSIEGICKLIRTLRKKGKTNCFSAMVSQSSYTKERIRKAGGSIKEPNDYSKINFVTSANFEGVDYYDKEGVTYIISDNKHEHTKYSIVTTIPQIVGRHRDSIYSDTVTVIFNNKDLRENKTEKDVLNYIDYRQDQAGGTVETYYDIRDKSNKYQVSLTVVKGAIEDAYIDILNVSYDLEDSFYIQPDLSFELAVSDNAHISELELFDLLNTKYYINSSEKSDKKVHGLSEVLGDAPILTSESKELFKSRSYGLKALCDFYTKDPEKCETVDPEWYDIINKLGVSRIESCGYVKTNVKALYNHVCSTENNTTVYLVHKNFEIGKVYTKSFIKMKLQVLGLNKAKASTISEYFVVKTTTQNNESCFKIISKK